MKHRARKRFGQNFLTDAVIIDRIVAAINPKAGDKLVEIGPGHGALTKQLLPITGIMDVIELDRDLIPELQAFYTELGQLTVHQADALQFNFSQLSHEPKNLRVVGNLPYNISTPLIFHLLSQKDCINDMHFMLQKEVVERLSANPGDKNYGRLSVMAQYHCQVDYLFLVPPDAFQPQPKVDSAIVRLVPYAALPCVANNERLFADVVRQAFSQRRKTLRNTLKSLISAEQLSEQGISPQQRPEQLSVEEFVRIANHIDKI
ncbi:MAG: 16S rRNA (adenine(1518)-N(6)/adenine(1519)-N(6))-dimethyltransferase [Legionellales bacterium]|nr:16S rRNA (adenine(1518)-N(6)/adenine(1519)-N(6))-dimethyltransferase [Legionellales bacterium]|tara:strand:+ start:9163 stop:9945 length:783 start_codon:yes stop_codon:yes gene_type:complete